MRLVSFSTEMQLQLPEVTRVSNLMHDNLFHGFAYQARPIKGGSSLNRQYKAAYLLKYPAKKE